MITRQALYHLNHSGSLAPKFFLENLIKIIVDDIFPDTPILK
jgi:hypothetical protein